MKEDGVFLLQHNENEHNSSHVYRHSTQPLILFFSPLLWAFTSILSKISWRTNIKKKKHLTFKQNKISKNNNYFVKSSNFTLSICVGVYPRTKTNNIKVRRKNGKQLVLVMQKLPFNKLLSSADFAVCWPHVKNLWRPQQCCTFKKKNVQLHSMYTYKQAGAGGLSGKISINCALLQMRKFVIRSGNC